MLQWIVQNEDKLLPDEHRCTYRRIEPSKYELSVASMRHFGDIKMTVLHLCSVKERDCVCGLVQSTQLKSLNSTIAES